MFLFIVRGSPHVWRSEVSSLLLSCGFSGLNSRESSLAASSLTRWTLSLVQYWASPLLSPCNMSALTYTLRGTLRATPYWLRFSSPVCNSSSSSICVTDFCCCREIGPTLFRNHKSGIFQGKPRCWEWMIDHIELSLWVWSLARGGMLLN